MSHSEQVWLQPKASQKRNQQRQRDPQSNKVDNLESKLKKICRIPKFIKAVKLLKFTLVTFYMSIIIVCK